MLKVNADAVMRVNIYIFRHIVQVLDLKLTSHYIFAETYYYIIIYETYEHIYSPKHIVQASISVLSAITFIVSCILLTYL